MNPLNRTDIPEERGDFTEREGAEEGRRGGERENGERKGGRERRKERKRDSFCLLVFCVFRYV